jgi:GntR family transcriptional regulator / MocR family aminotransferase
MPKAVKRGDLLLRVQRGMGEPLRAQLERALRDAIQTGRLAPGSILPSTRILAAELGVSRGLVVDAFEQLIAEGYLDARRGSATSVIGRPTASVISNPEPESPPASRFDFRPGRPDPALFPRRAWLSALKRAVANAASEAFDYPDPRGAASARTALAAYLNRSRATVAAAHRMLLCTGFAQGMRLVCDALKRRGIRRIAVEDPSHAFECGDVRASGLELVPVPVDEEGLCVDRVAKLKVGAVLIAPAHQYPTGAVLSPSRRSQLLAWAEQKRAFVVEDDFDGEYRYDSEPIGALQGLAPERVIYIGSASKILAPALRVGWVLLPAELVQDLSQIKLDADRGSPIMDQLAMAEFIDRGDLDRHLRRTRLLYRQRREFLATALRSELPRLRIRGIRAGLYLTLDLPEDVDESAIIAEGQRQSISLYGTRVYYARPEAAPPGLLLGYCRLSERDAVEGVRKLASLVKGGRFPRSVRRERAQSARKKPS